MKMKNICSGRTNTVAVLFVSLMGLGAAISNTDITLAPSDLATAEATEQLEKPPSLSPPLNDGENADLAIELQPAAINQPNSKAQPEKYLTEEKPNSKSAIKAPAHAVESSLDLSLPFKAENEVNLAIERNAAPAAQKANIFANDSRKKPQAIRVDGNVLMTQELEAEKRKTLDGAGISINVKP
jgi:hypothetical protein